jgi:hypothetical protein
MPLKYPLEVVIRYDITVWELGYNVFLLSQREHHDTIVLQYCNILGSETKNK